ncbi:AMP-binding protein [Cumulibacter manganitolerans]|uniref:AMP-binding protein n=1 Tax=Cumulibacter manganitolerans TaxID=1884992 RepID=UPI0018862D1B|nr:AMP-binding protein [Cumulibacter manganitolerans]
MLLPVTARCPLPFIAELGARGSAVALADEHQSLSYGELAARVADLAARLPDQGPRRICAVPLDRRVESVIGYLAVLAAGHVAAVVAPGRERDVEALRPALVVDGEHLAHTGDRGAAAPEALAVLMSTSGSTGSAKLVALSHQNLQANATGIAATLRLEADDVAITSLPLHYCYGLSILHSHLAAGASVVLTDLPVTDEGFWRLVHRRGVTSVAGVPHSFAMLRGSGLTDRVLPSVRRFTCAGGALAADEARELREIGARQGWDLYVMYGQTEATARMAVLSPEDAERAPGSVGSAVPGGRFEIEPVADHPDPRVGEIVYRGPNVMLGYVRTPADLADLQPLDRLHTGDLGYLDADGLLHVVGRRAGFVKVCGKRVDLAQLERIALEWASEACAVGADDALQIVCVPRGPLDADRVRSLLLDRVDLPSGALRVLEVDALPRLASGKVDRRAVEALAAASLEDRDAAAATGVLGLYRGLTGCASATVDDSFASLGGDSLTYVELSVRLEDLIGSLPQDWHLRTIRELSEQTTARSRWASVESSVLLRAVAALTILGTHIGLFTLLGGAHTLLAVLGFNIARFGLAGRGVRQRTARLARTALAIGVPTIVWVVLAHLALGVYGVPNMLLLNWIAGPRGWDDTDQLWFIETAVWSTLLLAIVLALPPVSRRLERRPFAVFGVLLGLALVPRFVILPFVHGPVRGLLPFAFWLVVLGAAVALATTTAARVVLSVVTVVSVAGFYDLPGRETYIALGILALIWVPSVRVPRFSVPLIAVVASASLYIYLIQWQVFPHLSNPAVAFALSVLAGVAGWAIVRQAQMLLRRRTASSRPPARDELIEV